ncbi:MAG: hypothetical protein WD512_03765 [Candidatus Paceibacterota bacterium]
MTNYFLAFIASTIIATISMATLEYFFTSNNWRIIALIGVLIASTLSYLIGKDNKEKLK